MKTPYQTITDFPVQSKRPSVPQDTVQISRSKPDSLHRPPAGFTALALDGYGLCGILPARDWIAGHRLGAMKQLTLATVGFERYAKTTRRTAFDSRGEIRIASQIDR
jgi:hypothetical protein